MCCARGYSHAHRLCTWVKPRAQGSLIQNENILGLNVVTTPTQPQHNLNLTQLSWVWHDYDFAHTQKLRTTQQNFNPNIFCGQGGGIYPPWVNPTYFFCYQNFVPVESPTSVELSLALISPNLQPSYPPTYAPTYPPTNPPGRVWLKPLWVALWLKWIV